MVGEVLAYLNNWFVDKVYTGTFTIEDGKVTLPLLDEQYFRVVGSVLNDGVYQYTDELELKDETFDGEIYALAVPNDLLDIVTEIETWQEKYGDAVSGPYNSESFGGYSYSKGSSSTGEGVSWKTSFADRLAPYRKLKGCDYAQPRYQDRGYKKPFNIGHPYGV
ncbi:MAG: hypothetical protein LUD72_10795 [Bacteroidales bacterium]|nr:hypothetical protein [Bacteroidales bacterium]